MKKQLGRGGLLSWAVQLLKTLLLRIMSQFKAECQSNYPCHSLHIVPKYAPIPRVKGLPLVGTLFDLIAAGGAPKLHKYVDTRHQQYGGIFRECLGGTQDAVFVSSAHLMRSIFQQEGHYPQHPLPDAWTFYNKRHACQRGLFFMEGAEWLHNRRILNRLLLNGNLNWMDVHIENCTRQLVDKWRAGTEEAQRNKKHYELPQLEQQLYRWSIEVLCGIMFGSTALATVEMQTALDQFTQIVHKVFEHSSRLMNFPPKLAQLLHLRIWRDFEQNVSEVLKQGAAIIELCINTQSQQPQPASEGEEALYHKLQAAAVPSEMIRRIFVDLVIAAGDTTAFSSQWALYVLSQDLVLQQRIAAERIAGESQVLHGVIKETLRLYPVAPFIGRYMPQDAIIGGHHVEKNTMVLISLYTAGRDPSHFEQPLRVWPERWFLGSSDQVHQAHGSLPFAIGQRSCIGRRVALKQLHALLGKCATQFTMQCLNEKPVDCVLRMVTVPDQTLCLALTLKPEVKPIHLDNAV
ncbi:cytochrome P450 315a1, mitochondrial [Drosophila albomicans]|uniref:Cytochrome P450 315a1, mitochondrial n=1 Tax=Drosophila albomicans TaxID=7291 RepID=A0A6P8XNK8_DROAB|nr:cytochrome P450 315a1, mitochondrial [Drosophila albomicans]